MGRYAKNTSVPVSRSRNEIENVLKRYGADQFVYGWRDKMAIIGFKANGRMINFELPLPDASLPESKYAQEERHLWRVLLLVIKAKLEAVESKVTTFENEFLAHTVLPNGQTFGQWANPQIEKACLENKMPKLLPG